MVQEHNDSSFDVMVFTLQEICIRCHLPAEDVLDMVAYGIVEPEGASRVHWRFTATDLLRLHKARRIRKDLKINLSGIALGLELMDQIEELKSRLRHLGVD